jgi:hypothetical protein
MRNDEQDAPFSFRDSSFVTDSSFVIAADRVFQGPR